jgi:hypothetical protein
VPSQFGKLLPTIWRVSEPSGLIVYVPKALRFPCTAALFSSGVWEQFNFFGGRWIRVSDGHYLWFAFPNAVSRNPVIRTDAKKTDYTFNSQAMFKFYKCGDPGADRFYQIAFASGTDPGQDRNYLIDLEGAVRLKKDRPVGHGNTLFRLIRQPDGSFALQGGSGRFVTAVGGGDRISDPVLETNRTQVQDWEKFRLWAAHDCAYAFQTMSGHWIGLQGDKLITRSVTTTTILEMNKFRLHPTDLFDPISFP